MLKVGVIQSKSQTIVDELPIYTPILYLSPVVTVNASPVNATNYLLIILYLLKH